MTFVAFVKVASNDGGDDTRVAHLLYINYKITEIICINQSNFKLKNIVDVRILFDNVDENKNVVI